MDVSIIIISYNTRELTLACLRSVYQQTRDVAFEVIVLDNASSDGSADAIAAGFPQTRLIRLEKNVGFARGNNLAAVDAQGDFFLLLNPDTEIMDAAVQKVVAFARNRRTPTITGGRTFFADGSLNYNSCHGRLTPWSAFCMGMGLSSVFRRSWLFDPESLGCWKRDTVRKVDAVTGCFLLIDRHLWKKLNGFDESFFMYGEDTDLCLRAWQTGASCVIFPDARLIHHGGQSEKVRADKMLRLFRAKGQLIQRHWPRYQKGFGIEMLSLWIWTRMVGLRLLSGLGISDGSGYAEWREIWGRRREIGAARS
jgi:GT2 family glycosyltransferase